MSCCPAEVPLAELLPDLRAPGRRRPRRPRRAARRLAAAPVRRRPHRRDRVAGGSRRARRRGAAPRAGRAPTGPSSSTTTWSTTIAGAGPAVWARAWSGDATRVAGVVAAGGAAGRRCSRAASARVRRRSARPRSASPWRCSPAGILAAARLRRTAGRGRRSRRSRCPWRSSAGWHLLGRRARRPRPHLLVATTALVVWAVAGAVGTGRGLWIFVAGATAGLLGAAGRLAAIARTPRGRGRVVLVAVVIGGDAGAVARDPARPAAAAGGHAAARRADAGALASGPTGAGCWPRWTAPTRC